MRNSLMLTVAAASLLSAGSAALAGSGTWVPANVPSGGSNFTMFGVNNKNVVTGGYTDASGNVQGVIGPFDGSNYKNFNDGGTGTQPRGLNDKGVIAGFDTGTLQQWERSASGKLKSITQGGNPVALALAMGVNNAGVFAGDYDNSSGIEVGAIGSSYKYTKPIKLSSKLTTYGYAGRGIDTAGDVAGWYYDSSGLQHGYAIVSGTTIKVDFPNAVYTVVEGMNDKGMLSGQWEDSSGVIHGFAYSIAKKHFKSLDAPGASFTQVWGINNHNVISASAAEASGTESFAYCMSANGCPSGAAAVHRPQQRSSGKAIPQAN